jgi:hypothetical protein
VVAGVSASVDSFVAIRASTQPITGDEAFADG